MLLSRLLAVSILTLGGCGTHPMGAAAPVAARQAALRAQAAPDPARFFAHADIEAKAPGAFALQAESHAFLEAAASVTQPQRDAFVASIRANSSLAAQVAKFDTLGWDAQVPVLRQVAALEAQSMGFVLPPLVIQSGANPIPSFFDFDPAKGGTGRVILYPDAIAKESNKWTALMLTVHEIRHSGQFQLAFGATRRDTAGMALSQGFKAAFVAQKALSHQLSFCDFCSLLNEYEAFQTGNYVVGALTHWTVDTSDEGCLSSQFDATGKPKLDLLALNAQVGATGLLDAFNKVEQVQFQPAR
jgi:hypothetical protein